MMKLIQHIAILLSILIISYTHKSAAIYFADAEDALDALQLWYNNTYGLWVPSTGWWNSANCLTTLANLAALDAGVNHRLSGLWKDVFEKAPRYNALMTRTLGPHWRRGTSKSGHFPIRGQRRWQGRSTQNVRFLNGYYDDEGWWALAWIAVYDLTREPKYLTEAKNIFNDMNNAFNSTPLGGLWWDKDKTYVNAIANGLYFSVAAHLSNRCAGDKPFYLEYALKSWNWFFASGLINDRNNIVDGLNVSKWEGGMARVWSYNQGVILGALVELSQATGESAYTDISTTIADAALNNLTKLASPLNPNLILHDSCEPDCGIDGASFKGIFARNLAKLYSAAHVARYGEFLMKNAEAVWQNGRNLETNQLGLIWAGPFLNPASGSTQCSAMDVMVGALAQFSEWNGNGTFDGSSVISQGEVGGGQPWDTVSWLQNENRGKIETRQQRANPHLETFLK